MGSTWARAVYFTENERLAIEFINGVCCEYLATNRAHFDLCLAWGSTGGFIHAILFPANYRFRDPTWPYVIVTPGCEKVMKVRKDDVDVGTRAAINLITGVGISLTVVDDAANDEVEITLASSPDTVRVSNSTTQSIATGGSGTAITADTETWDSNNLHSTSSNTSRLTAARAGKYIVTANAQWAANATGQRSLFFRKNGTSSFNASTMQATSAGLCIQSIAEHMSLAANDYVEVMCVQSSGGNLNITLTGFGMTYLAP